MKKEFFAEFARGFADKANKMKNFIIKHIDKVMTLVAGFAAAGIVKAFAPLLGQEPIPIDEVSFKLVLWGVLLSGFFVTACCTVGALLGKIAQKISQNEQKIQKKEQK